MEPFLSGTASVSAHARSKLLYHELAPQFELAIGGDTEREVEALCVLVERYGEGGNAVLDVGCGIGRHSGLLSGAGFRVTGVDASSDMLARAREMHPTCDFLERDFRNLALGRRQFDTALMMWTTLNYTDSQRDASLVFQQVRRALRVGGVFIVDVKNFDQDDRDTSYERTASDDRYNLRVAIRKSLIGDLNVATYDYVLHDALTGDRTSYSDQEIARRITCAQLRDAAGPDYVLKGIFGDFQLYPFNAQRSPRILTVWKAC